MRKVFITKSPQETKKIGKILAKEILRFRQKRLSSCISAKAVVLGLIGDLGGGKTTFLQGFASGLGVREKILSPTFVIMKRFKTLSKRQREGNIIFCHMDCYRLKNGKDAVALGIKNMLSGPKNIIAIEWADKIKSVVPKNAIEIRFFFIDQKTRKIILDIPYTIRALPL